MLVCVYMYVTDNITSFGTCHGAGNEVTSVTDIIM